MEELLIEEKAKRYDSMFERLKEMYNNNKTNVAARLICERYFPELKESEGERMIQYFKDLAPFDKADELYEKYGFSHKDAIAWLEKQGEHAKFINGIQVGDKVTRNEDGVLVNLSQLKRIAKPNVPKQEWSEDTQQWIDAIIFDYESWYDADKDHRTTILAKINILKSLKERCTWKPSDEQMDALHYVTNFDYGGHKATLVSLYEQLKKLKG